MIGEWVQIGGGEGKASIPAWNVTARDARRGGVVVIQEIFGVNWNIRKICDDFAEHGYEVLAPAMFDRRKPGFVADEVTPDSVQEGIGYARSIPPEEALADAQAAIDFLKAAGGPVFFTGFCYGGSISWRVAQRGMGVAAVSSFYGSAVFDNLEPAPKVPTIMNFGREDHSIPLEKVEILREKYPDLPVHIYDAGHGFMSEGRSAYNADAAKLGWLRTLQLFQQNSGSKTDH
jgi:carboxymethylenebutenolidase